MSKPEKIFKSTTDQLDLLQRRGLVIDDPMFAEEALIRTSYYEIINGYKDLFIDVNVEEERFQSGTTFSEIYYLYELDNTLRFSMLSATLSAENLLRSVIAYVLAEEHGHSVKDYQHNRNFRQGKKIMHGRAKGKFERELLLQIFTEVYHSNHQPMTYYRETYQDMPPWILVKGLSFGNLQYLFKLMLPESKARVIARATGMSLELIDDHFKQSFSEMFDILVAFRNWAAHGGRVYNHRVRRRLSHSPAHARLNVTHSAYQKHGRGRDDILSFIIALSYLRDRGMVDRFIHSVTSEINDYVISFPRHEDMLLSQMNLSTALYKEWLHNL